MRDWSECGAEPNAGYRGDRAGPLPAAPFPAPAPEGKAVLPLRSQSETPVMERQMGVSTDPGFAEVEGCGTLLAARTGSTGPKAAPLLVSVKRVLPLGTSSAKRARSPAVRAV